MPTHITARIAWHNDGWNGAVCREPELNTYCIGAKSYPGDVIARTRDLPTEMACAGCAGGELKDDYVPPCSYSYNAFGAEAVPGHSNPPAFFPLDGARPRSWELPPATVCVWPFEAMYGPEVRVHGYYDNDKRRELALEFFAPVQIDCGENLVFYYANYSNPLSEEEQPRYVLIGAARISSIGEELLYENATPEVAKKYAGGMVWARNVTSRYPDGEGVRLPYHRYIHDADRLRALAAFPEDPVLFKYGSKHLSDDQAIGLLEQLLARVNLLREWGDDSEDWAARERWLQQAIAALWTHRGLYPGLLRMLDAIEAHPLIATTKAAMDRDHKEAHALVFTALDQGAENPVTADLTAPQLKTLSRAWRLKSDDEKRVLREVLTRLDLRAEVMAAVIAPNRSDHGLPADLAELADNPYALAELYVGNSASDRIGWSVVDRGVLPLADLGPPLADVGLDDERRFRALCVEHLRGESNHTFRFAAPLVEEINARMRRLPETRQAAFTTRYFRVDADFLSERLTLSTTPVELAVYLRTIFEDERLVERVLTDLGTRPDIALRRPVTDANWLAWVRRTEGPLALKGGEAYQDAVREQAEACARLFRRPLALVTGAAGTGKTTVITALVRAVRLAEGEGASLMVLAPTGKAADRAREVFEEGEVAGVSVQTVHSLLAREGWLNDNLTFKRTGGKRISAETVIIDESSMLDLELAAALVRSIDWASVRRLVLVGDAGQLPPIGRGRVFADVIAWLERGGGEGLGRLTTNLRQMINRVTGEGQAIVALSELFVVDDGDKGLDDAPDRSTRPDQERLIEGLHAGGRVDKDLDVLFYREPTELADLLIGQVTARMRATKDAPERAEDSRLWSDVLKEKPTSHQVLTPHRGELHGVEALNDACQKHVSEWLINRVGAVDGVTVCDKVIQVRNRPRSDMIWAYDWNARKLVQAEVFNGEIGVVELHPFDKSVRNRWKTGYGKRLDRFNVKFTRKPNLTVAYGKDVPTGGKYKTEQVEDNLELAYAVSVHKAQGSEFDNTYVVIPKGKGRGLSAELVYTALTRAKSHCTLLIEGDVSSLLDARRRENAQTPQINSSLFELHVAKPALWDRRGWYEAGKIHEALSGDMVRSKSEVIIANLLHQRDTPFRYEQLLTAGDGTVRLPDFTVTWAGETWYWEHLGRLDLETYAADWAVKRAWYERWFPGRLVTTEEGEQLSRRAQAVLDAITGQPAPS